MTIAILSAMAEENASLVQQMESVRSVEIAQRIYHTGTLWGRDVVVVFSHWGKVAAASTATILIHHFKVTEILFTGVAGAIDPTLRIGDIVIADMLYQHDMDARPMIERHEIPLLGIAGMAANTDRLEQLEKASQNFVKHDLKQVISSDTLTSFSLSEPSVKIAAIASGDQFISSTEKVNDIRSRLSNVACVEMEGGAIAQVCTEFSVPFSVVRTISDSANEHAAVDFPRFISEVAQVYSLGIVQRLFKKAF